MIFLIVAFMLLHLESLMALEFNILSSCPLCTLWNEGYKSETDVYEPLGFLSHLQYKNVIWDYQVYYWLV